MDAHHPLGSLAPRDIVARAIDREMKRTGDPFVLLDCSSISEEEIRHRFPNILRETAARGIDMLREPLPVVPAAHYLCGGVLSDALGRSTLPGLYAIGETACTGVHGANRLASNSLLEALVFAHRASEHLERVLPAVPSLPPAELPRTSRTGEVEAGLLVHDRDEIRSLMWDLVGIVRTDERLQLARGRLEAMAAQHDRIWQRSAPTADLVELRNLVQIALLIVRCAQLRGESRGLHYNLDHPHRDNEHFLRDTVLD
jgi:L-aspartate oxidase